MALVPHRREDGSVPRQGSLRIWRGRTRRRAFLVALGVSIASVGLGSEPADAATVCGPSASWTLCITTPNGLLSGEVPVTVTATGTGTPFEVTVSWGTTATSTTPLYADFEAPFDFVWPTHRYRDADQWLVARVESAAGAAGSPVALRVQIENGNDLAAPVNAADYATRFVPRVRPGDPVLAAVGDGASGRTRSIDLANGIYASNATAYLNLGDVYERGTRTEYFNHYGIHDLDDAARSSRWGKLASFTLPTGGNHELHSTSDDGMSDYWHQRPLYYTEVVGGVRIISLSSECARVGGCGVGSPQYQFAQVVLAANTQPCVIGMWHRPVLSSVSDSTAMQPLWALFASNGGDLVLNGHTHSMSAYKPLNASLQAGQPDSHTVQIVSGAGGHNLDETPETDARLRWELLDVPGVAYITVVGGAVGNPRALSWRFADATGATYSSATGVPGEGSVDCSSTGAPAPFYTDDFATLFGWPTQVNLSLDATQGATMPPSVRATPVGQSAYGYHDFSPAPSVCASARVNVTSLSTTAILLKSRTAANGGLGRLRLDVNRRIFVRNDRTGGSTATGVALPPGWHTVELCTTVGTTGNLSAYLDGVQIANVTTNLGTAPAGRIQIFDNSGGRTFDARLDDLVLDTLPG